MKLKQGRGFTLIELLVVVFIIGLLSSVIIVNTTRSRSRARDARRKSDFGTISSAVAQYYADNRYYPSGNYTNMSTTLIAGRYLASRPSDPSGGTYAYSTYPPGCNNTSSYCTAYLLQATLESSTSGPTVPSTLLYVLKNGEESSTTTLP